MQFQREIQSRVKEWRQVKCASEDVAISAVGFAKVQIATRDTRRCPVQFLKRVRPSGQRKTVMFAVELNCLRVRFVFYLLELFLCGTV